MKKIAAILLILLYSAASSGATVHFHYCMGKLQGAGLLTPTKDRCGNCGMSKVKNACCKDVHKTIKAQKNYQHASISYNSTPFTTCMGDGALPVATHLRPAPSKPILNEPPPGPTSLFTLFCTYRI